MEGFLRYEFGGLYLEGLIHEGTYFWNFTVLVCCDTVRTKSAFGTFFERFLGKFNQTSVSYYMQSSVKNNIYYKLDL